MKKISCLFLIILSMPLIANASLIIESVTCNGNGLLRCALPGQDSNTTRSATNTVGAGDEFDINNLNENTTFSINVDESSFTIRNTSAGAPDLSGFGSLGLTDFNWVGVTGNIVGVTLFTSGVSTSTQPNNDDGTSLDLDDITFTTDSVVWNMAHTNWAVDSFATFTVETTESVSAPGALSLLALGLLGFGLTGRRRRFA